MKSIKNSFINECHNNEDESKPLLTDLENQDNECVICLEDMNEITSRTLTCGHIFHSDCIDSWNHIQVNCPICRTITSITFKGYIIPTLWCIFFKKKATILCNKKSIDITTTFLWNKKINIIPYTKIQSISATTDYLILHLKQKNIMIRLININASALYNLLYNTLNNYNTSPAIPF